MPPSKAELAAKHARLLELAAEGWTTRALALELHMDRRSVRQIRNDAGLPADPKPVRQPLTLEEKWAALTRKTRGGHRKWLGERAKRSGTPVMRYREQSYSPAAIAFRIRTGRDAVGQTFAECGYPHCVAPEHVDDTTTRFRNRDALRKVLGMPAAPERCVRRHDQAVEGRRGPDGVAYCEACKRERRFQQVKHHGKRRATSLSFAIPTTPED
jgi:hypothetical protein